MPHAHQTFKFNHFGGHCSLGGVSMAGFHLNGPGIPEWRTLEYYAMAFIVSGEADYEDNQGPPRRLVAGDLLLMFPGIEHRYTPLGDERWSELWYTFYGPAFELWQDEGILDPSQPVRRVLPVEYWRLRLEAVLTLGQKYGQSNPLRLVTALQEVLAEALANQDEERDIDDDQSWLATASLELDTDNLAEAASLPEVAERLDMTYDQFRRRFSTLSGMTPGMYRSSRLMDHACRLIHTCKYNNRQIAEHCGFSSEYHFSRRFKQIVGITPKAFRNFTKQNADVKPPSPS